MSTSVDYQKQLDDVNAEMMKTKEDQKTIREKMNEHPDEPQLLEIMKNLEELEKNSVVVRAVLKELLRRSVTEQEENNN